MYNLESAIEFLKEIDEPYAMIFDKDSDGICSAAMIYKFLLNRGIKPGLATCKDETGINISSSLREDASKFKHVIFLDMPMDQSNIANQLPGEKVLIVDHHVPQNDLSSDRILHINPRFEGDKIYLPTSYLAFKLTESTIKKFSWIAGTGVVGDYGVKDCKDLMDIVAQDYPNMVVEDRYNQKEMWNSGLGMLSAMIASAFGIESYKGANEAFSIFSIAEDPRDITSSNLMSYYDEYQGEIERLKNDFRARARHFSRTNSYLYKVESKYQIMSVLSTLISEEFPDSVVINYRVSRNHVEFSSRCQSGRVDVAKLMQEITKGFGKGGGHQKAAGGEASIDNKDEVLERLELKLSDI